MPEHPLGMALIGCGGMGMTLADQAATIAGVRIVAGFDTADAARQRFVGRFGETADETVEAMLARPGIDAVIVATPPALHRPMVEAAAGAGKHVFCEKPLALTLIDCDAIIAACAGARVRLMVG